MKEKEIEILTSDFLWLMWSKRLSVRKAHQLLDCVYNVAWYRLQFRRAETPGSTALARWSLDEARNLLSLCLVECGFCDIDRNSIITLSENLNLS